MSTKTDQVAGGAVKGFFGFKSGAFIGGFIGTLICPGVGTLIGAKIGALGGAGVGAVTGYKDPKSAVSAARNSTIHWHRR